MKQGIKNWRRISGLTLGALGLFFSSNLLAVDRAKAVSAAADFVEFPTAKDARAFGWSVEAVNSNPALTVIGESKAGKYAIKASGKDFMGDWGTVFIIRDFDFAKAKKGDKIVFYLKQNVASGLTINVDGIIHRDFKSTPEAYERIELDMDPAQWEWEIKDKTWKLQKRISIYSRIFNAAGKYIIIDGLSFIIDGREVPANIPASTEAQPDATTNANASSASNNETVNLSFAPPPAVAEDWVITKMSGKLPQENAQAWLIGDKAACWAISKQNGSIIGGWNNASKERYLENTVCTYFLENRKIDLLQASENGDVIKSFNLSPVNQELTLVCSNPALPGIQINKTYSIRNSELNRKISFISTLPDDFFLSYSTEAKLMPKFRDSGSYVGTGSFGPVEWAQNFTGGQPLHYTNSRGILLSNHGLGYTLAQYRFKQDDKFVLPWWTYSRSESAKDSFYYTPSGWKMASGISRLSRKGKVSYDEIFAITKGNYHDFLVNTYNAKEDVRNDIDSLGPVPEWLNNAKILTFEGEVSGRPYETFNRLKRMVETTDDGYIIVVINDTMGLNVGDYYVEQGLDGFHGGYIKGQELADWMKKVKALSPRIKIGIYCYMDMSTGASRLCKAHPEWFRANNKEGSPVNHFAGFADTRTSMFNNPELRKALVNQYDLMFKYLDADLVYLDDAMCNNIVNWDTNQVLQERDCYDFMREVAAVARKNGPDKFVIYNGQGNPYGDVEFIEAFTRLNDTVWRTFAGVALGVETFLLNRPGVRVVPLYWTEELDREYVNRILALGWVPALEATDVLASRPFITAAYEIGNENPVNAQYTPDWRKDVNCQIESYSMRRLDDNAVILSFINYAADNPQQPIEINADTLGLDKNKPLYVTRYQVKDANQYKGFASEKAVKENYANGLWSLDTVTAPQFVYAGDFQSKLDLKVKLPSHVLVMLVISNDPGVVYSMDNLPMNYLFGKTPGVKLTSNVDAAKKEITIKVNSGREAAEITSFMNPNWIVKEVKLDGEKISPDYITLNNTVTPLIKVAKGEHTIQIVCNAATTKEVKLNNIQVNAANSGVKIKLPGNANKALVVIEQAGQVLFNRMVGSSQGTISLGSVNSRGGDAELSIKFLESDGVWVKAASAPVKFTLPNNPPGMNLSPKTLGEIPEVKVITPVNKNVMGLDVLNSAKQTTATTITPFMSDFNPLSVDVSVDSLTIDAGTTRKIETYMGAAFGGFEIKNLRTAKIKLKNTYFTAKHIYGKNVHTHLYYYQPPRLFAGFMVDYHTKDGYTKRVALSVGVVHPKLSTPFPDYGKASAPDQIVDLGPIVLKGTESILELDLSAYAPKGWDGQVWFSAGSDWALPGRRLNAQIIEANYDIGSRAIKGNDPAAIHKAFLEKETALTVPKINTPVTIDGKLDDAAWAKATKTQDFYLVGGSGRPTANTEARLMYDNDNLYIAFKCDETKRKKPIFGSGDLWLNDEVEVYLDTENQKSNYISFLLSSGGSQLSFNRTGKKLGVNADFKTTIDEGKGWTVEAAIPFKSLGKAPHSGETWALNLCRYRPEGAGFPVEPITWAPTGLGFGGNDIKNFGSLIFK